MAKDQILTPEEVVKRTSEYLPEEDVSLVQKAYEFAKEAHKEQFRKSGEPYIIHPIQVAGSLQTLKWTLPRYLLDFYTM
ncbi:GTP pyrophosphokinase (ppGpp synthetase) [Bacillus sp. SG-1]|nr:GTP pyrophosphokinase (ppGpp synthetase) [Bacillus sp. SG-1]